MTKEGTQAKYKNSKTTCQNQSNKKNNENINTVCHQKNTTDEEKTQGKRQTSEKKYSSTESNFLTNDKSPKGRHRDKTTHPRPTVHSTTSLPTNKKIETENFKMKN